MSLWQNLCIKASYSLIWTTMTVVDVSWRQNESLFFPGRHQKRNGSITVLLRLWGACMGCRYFLISSAKCSSIILLISFKVIVPSGKGSHITRVWWTSWCLCTQPDPYNGLEILGKYWKRMHIMYMTCWDWYVSIVHAFMYPCYRTWCIHKHAWSILNTWREFPSVCVYARCIRVYGHV